MQRKRPNDYYTLVASLPPLPRYDRAERVPINRVRLFERLKMLRPEDAEVVEHVYAFLGTGHLPVVPGDREIVAHHERLKESRPDATFWAVLEFPIDVKTVVTALRRRRLGHPCPAEGEPWGIGRLTGPIRRNWEQPDFRLSGAHPWVPRVRASMESGDALALQKLLFDLTWNHVDRVSQGLTFSFDAVLAYLYKWDLIDRWISYDAEAAGVRFEELLMEAMDGKEHLFD